MEVLNMMKIVDKSSTSAPMNIQNSRESAASSFFTSGIFRKCHTYRAKAATRKTNMKASSCPLMPRSVNACTEVVPRMPLRVRNVAYNTRIKAEMKKKKVDRRECPVRR